MFRMKSGRKGPRDVRWRKAMLSALDRCKNSHTMKPTTRSRALYCIREFEEVNGCAFNPLNSYHCSIVAGMGPFSAVLWRVNPHRLSTSNQKDDE